MSTARERSGIKSNSDLVTIKVNGEAVLIDQRTLTMRERQQVKSELHKLDYPADDMDALMGAIWIVMRRSDPTLKYSEVCESITVQDLSEAETVEADDHPEASGGHSSRFGPPSPSSTEEPSAPGLSRI